MSLTDSRRGLWGWEAFPNFGGKNFSLEEARELTLGIKKELEEHEGEFVLVVTRHERRKQGRYRSELADTTETNCYLAIIKPPFLAVDENHTFAIPSDRYVAIDMDRDFLRKNEGNISSTGIVVPHIFAFGETVNGLPKIEIVVGDAAVCSWVKVFAEEHNILPINRQLIDAKRRRSESEAEAEKARFFDSKVFFKFKRMQEVLERVIDLPADLAKVYQEQLLKRKEEVLSGIERFVAEDGRLVVKLSEMQGIKLPRIGNWPDPTYDKQVSEDESDIGIFSSIPVNQERQRVLAQLESNLKEAFELGMHKEPWTITQNPKPGVKVEIDVPALINGYCARYEIQIPQDK